MRPQLVRVDRGWRILPGAAAGRLAPADATRKSFADLGLCRFLCAALDATGFKHPSPPQLATIPMLLEGTTTRHCTPSARSPRGFCRSSAMRLRTGRRYARVLPLPV